MPLRCSPRIPLFLTKVWLSVLLVAISAVPPSAHAEDEGESAAQAAPERPVQRSRSGKRQHKPVLAAQKTVLAVPILPTRVVRTLRIDMTPTASMPDARDATKTEVPAKALPEKSAKAPPVLAPVPASALVAVPESDARAFCANVGRAASDARVAWQAARLVELENGLKARIVEYESKTAEWRDWLARRDEALRRADESVVAIYSRMKPDAAAAQLSVLDDALAAAILTKLNARNASAVLGEMGAERAARLADEMSGARIRLAEGRKAP